MIEKGGMADEGRKHWKQWLSAERSCGTWSVCGSAQVIPLDMERKGQCIAGTFIEDTGQRSSEQRFQERKGKKRCTGNWRNDCRGSWRILQGKQGRIYLENQTGKIYPCMERRVEIPKPDGGIRKLGIPTVKAVCFSRQSRRSWHQSMSRCFQVVVMDTDREEVHRMQFWK